MTTVPASTTLKVKLDNIHLDDAQRQRIEAAMQKAIVAELNGGPAALAGGLNPNLPTTILRKQWLGIWIKQVDGKLFQVLPR